MSKAPLAIALSAGLAAAAIAVGLWRIVLREEGSASAASHATAQSQPLESKPLQPRWSTAAPGRVEPRGGEIQIAAPMAGKAVEVLVDVNDHVKAGDLMIHLDDDEPMSKLAAAESEAAARKRQRDAEKVVGLAHDRRTAEDNLYTAERALFHARLDLDRRLSAMKTTPALKEELDRIRQAIAAAADKVTREKANLRAVQASAGMPLPTRLESALAAARAEVAVLDVAISRARIRAPIDATVLDMGIKIGETAIPSPEHPLVVIGDVSSLRVRAEVDERDVSKVRLGQSAVIKSDAFPDRQFSAKVVSISPSLGAPRITARSQRKPTDVVSLEVLLDLEDGAPLLTGMRTDVFFRPDGPALANQ
jgi:HlyD family secretion protein